MPTSEPLPENADQPEDPQPPQDVVRAPAQTHSPVTVLIAQLAVDARLDGHGAACEHGCELGARTGDSVAAGLTGFSVGFAIVLLGTVLIPAGRRGLITALGAFRARRLPAIFLLSGVFGAFLVVVQTVTTPMVGVSVFILGMVVGQSVGGLGVDRAGIGPGGMKPLTGWRLLGTAIIVVAVLIAQLPHLGGEEGAPQRSMAVVLALLLLPVLAGLGSALQTAFNGRIGAEAGTPITPTVLNFAEGVLALIVATVIHRLTADLPPWHFPSEWWLYLGGVCGVLFVAAGAVLSRIIGILRTSLSLTAGMLTGALLLDLLVPTSGAVVAPLTVLGTALTFVGLVVVSLPWKRRASTA